MKKQTEYEMLLQDERLILIDIAETEKMLKIERRILDRCRAKMNKEVAKALGGQNKSPA